MLRLASIALGMGRTIWAAYLLATILFAGTPLVGHPGGNDCGCWPQFVFMSRALTNDVLATALAAVTLVLLVQVGSPQRFVEQELW